MKKLNTTKKKKLDILVAEDNPVHQEAAKTLLKGHKVKIVDNFFKAADSISSRGGSGIRIAYHRRYNAVLTTLKLARGKGKYKGDENRALEREFYGYTIALMAIKERIPYIAIVADVDFDVNGPMDFHVHVTEDSRLIPNILEIENSRLGIYQMDGPGGFVDAQKTSDGRIVPYDELDVDICTCEGTKDWKAALDLMME